MSKLDYLGSSPHLEIIVRKVYRRFADNPVLNRLKRRLRSSTPIGEQSLDEFFSSLEHVLPEESKVAVIHSSYSALSNLCDSPSILYDSLKTWFLNRGVTLVLPIFPVWPKYQPDEGVFRFRNRKCRIWTGVLPLMMQKDPAATLSEHPFNTVGAIGPLAESIVEGNISGSMPLPCGPNSSWKHCVDHDATVLGLGIDLVHSLTMIHVSEDCNVERWPRKDWYVQRRFTVEDVLGTQRELVVRQRNPTWGENHFAERKLARDLRNSRLLTSHAGGGVTYESISSKRLYEFLDARVESGYPYYWI